MLKKVTSIEGVYSGLRIDNETVSYYTNDFRLRLLSSGDLSLRKELSFDRDFEYKLIEGVLYVTKDGELQIIDLANNKLLKVCKTDKQYIVALSPQRFMGSSYRRKDREYDSVILDETCEVIWELRSVLTFRDIQKQHILLSDPRGNNIGLLNYESCKVVWQKELDQNIKGNSVDANGTIIIPLSTSLVAIDKVTGKLAWSKSKKMFHYNYDESTLKLYGLAGKTFEVLSANTGEVELISEFDEDLEVSPHLTFLNDATLYFSSLLNYNTPVLGTVDIKTGKLDFIQEIETVGEKSFRRGLEKPIVIGTRLYVRDAIKTLHIFEKDYLK